MCEWRPPYKYRHMHACTYITSTLLTPSSLHTYTWGVYGCTKQLRGERGQDLAKKTASSLWPSPQQDKNNKSPYSHRHQIHVKRYMYCIHIYVCMYCIEVYIYIYMCIWARGDREGNIVSAGSERSEREISKGEEAKTWEAHAWHAWDLLSSLYTYRQNTCTTHIPLSPYIDAQTYR